MIILITLDYAEIKHHVEHLYSGSPSTEKSIIDVYAVSVNLWA